MGENSGVVTTSARKLEYFARQSTRGQLRGHAAEESAPRAALQAYRGLAFWKQAGQHQSRQRLRSP